MSLLLDHQHHLQMCHSITERLAEEDTGSLLVITSDHVWVPASASCKVMQLFSPLFRDLVTINGSVIEKPITLILPDYDSDTWNRLMEVLKTGKIVDKKGTFDIEKMKEQVVMLAMSLGINLKLEKNAPVSATSSRPCTGLIKVRNLEDMMSTSTSAEIDQRADQDGFGIRIQSIRSLNTVEAIKDREGNINEKKVLALARKRVKYEYKKRMKLQGMEVSSRNLYEDCFGQEEVSKKEDHNYEPGPESLER